MPAPIASPSRRRWLHLWLPRLSVDRVRRGSNPPPSPFVLVARSANTLRIEAMDEAAEAFGLTLGLSLATARSRVPELAAVEADLSADKALLAVVGEVCRRFTPAVALAPPDGAHLDITGCSVVFGGEAHLAEALSARLERLGLTVRIGMGRTVGLAWALARYGQGDSRALKRMPVDALHLDSEACAVLHRLGLKSVGQILDMPRAALARRLGEALLHRLDEALGLRNVALNQIPEPVSFQVQHRLAEPLLLEAQVLGLARWLAERLKIKLEERGVGGRRFTLELFRVDGVLKRLDVPCARPLRDPASILALFSERLAGLDEGLEAAFGFDLVRLTAAAVEPWRAQAADFLSERDGEGLPGFLDRIAVRLGRRAVYALEPAPDSQIPERALRVVSPGAAGTATWATEAAALYQDTPLRPLTLFTPPQPIRALAGVPEDPPQRFWWRRLEHRIVRAEGPERIAAEWWLEPEPLIARGEAPAPQPAPADGLGVLVPPADRRFRDYYRLEDEQGRRFWVFREGAVSPDGPPNWFLHGLLP